MKAIRGYQKLLKTKLLEVRDQERERGITLVGPHRDDVLLSLGDHQVKGYASHGESWSMAISLRIGSFNLLKSEGSSPILILDDGYFKGFIYFLKKWKNYFE